MLIKFGSIVTSGSGSLGGHTIQNSTGGVQLRTKPIPKNTPSAAQLLIRSYNPKLQAGWRALTDAQRSTWNNFADTNITLLKNGDPVNLSGHSLWMKYNFYYLQDNLPLIASPFLFKTVRLGPELLPNTNFLTSDYWNLAAGCSIDNGQLTIDSFIADDNCNTAPVNVNDYTLYQLSYNCISKNTTIYFFTGDGNILALLVGKHTVLHTFGLNTGSFYLYWPFARTVGVFSYFSLKLVL